MVRRTKEEALETRSHILDTAEHVFSEKGVSRTSLGDIADAAGVTRGAIYWHFKNKADLYQAMVDRVVLPMEEMVRAAADESAEDPLMRVRAACIYVLKKTAEDQQVRRIFEVAFFKCEIDEEMRQVPGQQMECRMQCIGMFEKAFRNAIRRGQLPRSLDVRRAIIGLMAFVDGLLFSWLFKPDLFSLADEAEIFIDQFLAGLRTAPPVPRTLRVRTPRRAPASRRASAKAA